MEDNLKPIKHDKLGNGYFISPSGNVYSIGRVASYSEKSYTKPSIKIKASMANSGYLFVSLTKEHIKFYLHRLVAEYFCGGFTEEKNQVNHIDGNKLNNTAKNLEVVSQSENIKHNYTHLGYKSKSTVLTKDQADQVREIYSAGGVSQKKIAAQFNASVMVINRIINFKQLAYA